MEPRDIIWRLLERMDEQQRLLEESYGQLHPKKQADLISAIQECERLTRTQMNILNRMRRRYD